MHLNWYLLRSSCVAAMANQYTMPRSVKNWQSNIPLMWVSVCLAGNGKGTTGGSVRGNT